jgi:hypothetical protein
MKRPWMTTLQKYSPTILTCFGAAGVVATAVMAVKATPKAIELLDQARIEKCDDLTTLETIDIAGPVYIPSVIMGVTTIACIFGANILNKKSQAALMSAYALLDNSYKEYTRKAEEMYGDNADAHIKEELAKEHYEESAAVESDEEEELFFDFKTLQYFTARMDEVVQKVKIEDSEDGMECYIINTPFDPPSDLF